MVTKTRHEIDMRYNTRVSVWKDNGRAQVEMEDDEKKVTIDLTSQAARKLRDALAKQYGA
jgi:hypothetical protein